MKTIQQQHFASADTKTSVLLVLFLMAAAFLTIQTFSPSASYA